MKSLLKIVFVMCVAVSAQSVFAAKGSPNCEEGPHCEAPKNKEGKLEGLEVCKDSNKITRRTTEYKNGERNGQWKCFDEKAKLIETRIYANGMLNGKSTRLEEKINLFSVITYKDNLKEGEVVTYNTSTSNGKETVTEKIVSQYKNNDFHGWLIVYDASGKELRRDCYQEGNLKRDNPELCNAKKK